MDARRRQYVPLGVHFADGGTGTKLLERFGRDGLCVWACLLAAAKKSPAQGTFSYSSEAEAWTKLGLYGHEPDFTFTDFVATLGRLKHARREKRGRVVDVTLTHWGDWNQTIKRETEAEKKRRKRAQNTGDNRTPLGGTEGEGEGETPPSPRTRRSKASRNGNGHDPQDKPPAVACPHCRVLVYTQRQLDDHIENIHAAELAQASDDPDADIPF